MFVFVRLSLCTDLLVEKCLVLPPGRKSLVVVEAETSSKHEVAALGNIMQLKVKDLDDRIVSTFGGK